ERTATGRSIRKVQTRLLLDLAALVNRLSVALIEGHIIFDCTHQNGKHSKQDFGSAACSYGLILRTPLP
ncbi:MAG TPA: hypothetical protein VGE93_08075, partial [Bryobacteraceae bacterium]